MINGKIALHVRAPLMSRSGYGAHAREIVNYLLTDSRYLLFVESVNWGNCGSIHDFDLQDKTLLDKYYRCIANYEQAVQQKLEFDLSIQITIPNEFQRRAQYNIGVTAGIEVDRCTIEWVRKCNEMNLIVVPSSFSKDILTGTIFELRDAAGNKTEEKVTTPVVVIHQHFDKPEVIPESKFAFSTSKNLLFVGLWGNKGGYGEDRKNIANLIRIFLQNFGSNPDYGLILKTNIITDSPEDLMYTKEKIKHIKANFSDVKAKIYLIHENLSDAEMYSLYTHPSVTGFVSLTNGEGFGRPLLEAASCGLPVLATNWSGHLDFLREKHGFIPIDFELKEVPECQVWDGVIMKGSRWANIVEEDARRRMKKFLESSKPIKAQAMENVAWLEENFSKKAVHEKWHKLFETIINPIMPEELADVTDERILNAFQNRRIILNEVELMKKKYKIEKSMKNKALFILPQSFGDIVISTCIVNSLIKARHSNDEFYFATRPEYRELLDKLVEEHDVQVIDFDEKLLSTDLTREIWDYVYNPGLNVQYVFSNWTLGNGEYGVRLLEEFAKNCNLGPHELSDFCLAPQKCVIPKNQYITITPVSSKQSKEYDNWNDVIFNLKKMAPNVDIVQLGMKTEKLLDGVLDYRGKTFNETIYVVSKSILHISPDTGTAHVAGAFGVPHIVLFGSTEHNQCAPILMKANTAQVIIDTQEACQPRCYKDVCHKMPGGKNCLSHISAQTITTQAFNILSGIKSSKVFLPVLRLDEEVLQQKVDQWHETNSDKEVYEHLGLSKEMYSKFVEKKFEDVHEG